MLIERHASLAQALAHEVVAVEIGGDRERQVGRDPQAHRPHDRVPDVPVQVQEPLPSGLDPPVVLVATPRRPLRRVRDEGAAVLQAGQDAGDPLMGSQLPVVRPDQLLFPHPLRRWEQRDPLALGVLLDPRPIRSPSVPAAPSARCTPPPPRRGRSRPAAPVAAAPSGSRARRSDPGTCTGTGHAPQRPQTIDPRDSLPRAMRLRLQHLESSHRAGVPSTHPRAFRFTWLALSRARCFPPRTDLRLLDDRGGLLEH